MYRNRKNESTASKELNFGDIGEMSQPKDEHLVQFSNPTFQVNHTSTESREVSLENAMESNESDSKSKFTYLLPQDSNIKMKIISNNSEAGLNSMGLSPDFKMNRERSIKGIS